MLSSSSAAGPDGVPEVQLKTLHHLWRGSLDGGTIPTETLLVIICPVHKGGFRSATKQCMPFDLTSHLIKIFERVLRKH